jgi:hypothetical protein
MKKNESCFRQSVWLVGIALVIFVLFGGTIVWVAQRDANKVTDNSSRSPFTLFDPLAIKPMGITVDGNRQGKAVASDDTEPVLSWSNLGIRIPFKPTIRSPFKPPVR